MAKSNFSSRVPNNIGSEIERFKNENGIEQDSEAIRQLVERGLDEHGKPGPGERLAESATAISGVGSLVAVIAALFGSVWAWGVLMPFLSTTLVFALLLASIRVMAGKDLA